MPPKRMTANPIKPARYRPGKPVVEEPSSEEDEDSLEEEDQATAPTAPPPKASSFPSEATRIASNLKKVDLNERGRQAAADEAARIEAERVERVKEEEGFVTEESSEEEHSEDDEESGSEEEESNSEEEAPRMLLRPTFIKKDKRKDVVAVVNTKTEDDKWAEDEARRKAKANKLVQEQLEKIAAARAAGKKYWDDDEDGEVEQVDDTDDIDPEAERAAWKLRELKRVKREREAIEEVEKERDEIERRRNLSKEEREAEDKEFLDTQKEERESKGKMGYMQKYFHKGAFFQDDAKAEGLDTRDIMGSRYQDDVTNRELLPQYMQIRDMTRLGRKGRTKYKDLKSEDTGRWAIDGKGPRRGDGTVDERFMPDRDGGRDGPSGANATAVKERRRAPEGAPEGPRADNGERQREVRGRGDSYVPDHDSRDRHSDDDGRRRSARRRSYSRSRSPLRRRDGRRDDGSRRKRSPSPDNDRYAGDKRRRVDAT
ncbi:Micro-fibrillar-associated protein 1, C-terminal [Lasallia pustulata]|uniref:Micro-fibrillar-associated protein 1, C-terminal n=1 Tax=Lasallia pustulata TaxID=136370 RepID=A0A1W5D807_9LECA|nr:Micro-fibrillar-associated protein 1, C-terminal [Lasallia pustulata]